MFKQLFTLPVAMILTVLQLLSPAAHAVTIPAGYDFFVTGEASVDLGSGIGTVELESFFPQDGAFKVFPLSPAIQITPPQFQLTWVDRHGNQVGPNSIHAVGQSLIQTSPGQFIPDPITHLPPPGFPKFDTIVYRTTAVDPTATGSTVPIQMIWLC
jgi:hypothetical protein